MAKYRSNLPVMSDRVFLTDGGLETTCIFHDGMDLPEFAAFVLLDTDEGRAWLTKYFEKYISIAKEHEIGFILESPTWRASRDWGEKLGYSVDALTKVNRDAMEFFHEIRDKHETPKTKIVIGGCIGPRGDGYVVGGKMQEEEARDYHAPQINAFCDAEADMVSAITMTYTDEAIGIVKAAKSVEIPAVISFTVETDGKLPSGQSLKDAIETVDESTDNGPVYYMINCAHPTHFSAALAAGEAWTQRLRGIRANASAKSHAELNESEELDEGNPVEFGQQYRELKDKLINLNVLGGCCGTDHRHVEQICKAFLSRQPSHNHQ